MKRKKRRSKGKIILAALLSPLIGFGAYAAIQAMGADAAALSEIPEGARLVRLERKNLKREIIAAGAVISKETHYVVSSNPSRIKKVLVKPYDEVKKGDPLCTLETGAIEEAIAQLENAKTEAASSFKSEVGKAKDSIAKLEADTKKKKAELDDAVESRRKALDAALSSPREAARLNAEQAARNEYAAMSTAKQAYEKDLNNTSKKKAYEDALEVYTAAYNAFYDQQMASYANIQEQVAYSAAISSREAAFEQLDAALAQAKKQAGDATAQNPAEEEIDRQINALKAQKGDYSIVAPESGTVTRAFAREGGPAIGHLFTLENLSKLEVVSLIAEEDAARLKKGDPAKITGGFGKDSVVWDGAVEDVSPAADEDGNCQALFSISGDLSKLKSGSSVILSFEGEAREGVFAAPYLSVLKNSDGADTICLLEKTETAGENGEPVLSYFPKELIVETGIETDAEIEIFSPELVEGMEILADPQMLQAAR
jgi:multidrug resistance efflux pump